MGAAQLFPPAVGEVAQLACREDTIVGESSMPSTLAFAWIVTLLLTDREGRLERVEWVVVSRLPQLTLEYRTSVLICQ